MTKAEARQLVAIAVAACPTQSASFERERLDYMGVAWFGLLADISYDDAAAALKRWLATSHWLPAPAQIRAIVSEAAVGRARPGAEAWGDVLRAIGRYGRDRQPTFVDEVCGRAVSAFGWRALCDSENQIADRARFIELYDQLAARVAEDRAVATLPGIAKPALPGGGPAPLAAAVALALPAGEEDSDA